MGRCRVVQGHQDRLPLSDGDWIDVKRELNAGEYYDSIVALADRQAFAKVIAYLLGWSLVDLDGGPLAYSTQMPDTDRRDTLRSLDKATLREIVSAIDRHESQQDAARDTKKNDQGTSPASNPIYASAAP